MGNRDLIRGLCAYERRGNVGRRRCIRGRELTETGARHSGDGHIVRSRRRRSQRCGDLFRIHETYAVDFRYRRGVAAHVVSCIRVIVSMNNGDSTTAVGP